MSKTKQNNKELALIEREEAKKHILMLVKRGILESVYHCASCKFFKRGSLSLKEGICIRNAPTSSPVIIHEIYMCGEYSVDATKIVDVLKNYFGEF